MKNRRLFALFISGLVLSGLALRLSAQSPVLQFQANYISTSSSENSYSALPASPGSFSSCSGNNFTHNWNVGTQNYLRINSFTANSKNYVVSPMPNVEVFLRRVNNAQVTGNRNIIYSEITAASATSCPSPRELNFRTPYNDNMAVFLNNYVLNQGTDNIFTNAGNGDGNNNNIERVDVVFKSGVSSNLPADAGFLICERGTNNNHDGFRIAAILSIDASFNPTSFGAVRTCVRGNGSNNGSWGHPSIANGNKMIAAYVARKDPADAYLRVSASVNQELGGVFFSLSDLGVATNQVIYGYALIGPDGTANPSSAQLLNLNDAAVYPTGTTEAQGGGLDLIAVNTFFGTNMSLNAGVNANFSAHATLQGVNLQWNIQNIAAGTNITLEKMGGNDLFTPIYTYTHSRQNSMSYADPVAPGTYTYRLKFMEASGRVLYSRLVQVQVKGDGQDWRVFPTSLSSSETLTFEGLPDGNYEVQMTGVNGTVYKSSIRVTGNKGYLRLNQPALPAGIYYIRLYGKSLLLNRQASIILRSP